ncbi:TlpA disulfide reductase family protein [Pedobacter nutrimenti]|uniref:TlpA family protein disulfide reductase n=1 Tax=Pedobacter nutrimenti TaxID=1241337 RepID=UPI00292D0D2A|nr:TlpA disulfide reductase family protein [Pedobacter nutrimenti]
MRKIFAIAAILCGLTMSCSVFAEEGIKTLVKGDMTVQQGGASLFIEGYAMVQKGKANFTRGSFIMETTLKEPSFCILTTTDPIVKGFYVYLKPGDDLSVSVKDNQVVFSGKGSELNQFYVTLSRKYDFKNKQYTAKEAYINRVKAINASAIDEVKNSKAVLLGFTQGEYLNAVYGPYMEEKLSGVADAINKPRFDDLNLQLVPEVVQYYNWYRTINEMMYAKMETGQLKVRNSNTWLADFAGTIDNQKLREAYIVQLTDLAFMDNDFIKIKDIAKAALPLLKDPASIAKINGILARVDQQTLLNKALPGTDFGSYSFQKPDGTTAKISDYKGKYILIDIWSTWCHPCVAEMPFLKKLENDMLGKDVVFLSLNGDIKEEYWQDFMKKRNLTGNQVKMPKGLAEDPFFNQIGRTGIPRFVIIDREGKMVNAKCCERPSNPILKVYLNELLSK